MISNQPIFGNIFFMRGGYNFFNLKIKIKVYFGLLKRQMIVMIHFL